MHEPGICCNVRSQCQTAALCLNPAREMSPVNDIWYYWYVWIWISEVHVKWLTIKLQWLVRGSAFHAFWPWNEDYWIFQSNNFAASYIQHLICHHYVMSWRSDSYNIKIMGKNCWKHGYYVLILYWNGSMVPFLAMSIMIRHKVPSSRLSPP